MIEGWCIGSIFKVNQEVMSPAKGPDWFETLECGKLEYPQRIK